MSYSTSELDTLHFGNFMKNFQGGAPKVGAPKVGDSYSATSSWNMSDMTTKSTNFISQNINLIFFVSIAYLIIFTMAQHKSIVKKSKKSSSTTSPKPTTSPAPTTSPKPTASPTASPASPTASPTSPSSSVSVSVKKYEKFGKYF